MNQAGVDWQLIIYGGAMHGFTHKHSPALPGVAYHAPSDTRSATAIQHFLAELFGSNLTRSRLILSQRLVSQSTGNKEESVMAPQADSTRYALRTLCASLDAQHAALLHNFRLFQQR